MDLIIQVSESKNLNNLIPKGKPEGVSSTGYYEGEYSNFEKILSDNYRKISKPGDYTEYENERITNNQNIDESVSKSTSMWEREWKPESDRRVELVDSGHREVKSVKEGSKGVVSEIKKFLGVNLDSKESLTGKDVERIVAKLKKFLLYLLKDLNPKDKADGKSDIKELQTKKLGLSPLKGLFNALFRLVERLKDSTLQDGAKDILSGFLNSLDKEELNMLLEKLKELKNSDREASIVKRDALAKEDAPLSKLLETDGNRVRDNGREINRSVDKIKITDFRPKAHNSKRALLSSEASKSKSEGGNGKFLERKGMGLRGKDVLQQVKGDIWDAFSANKEDSSDSFNGKVLERARVSIANRLKALLESRGFKRGSIIVNRDGNGEIRLTLHPKNLGSVKIRLDIVENRIEGRIIVENSNVRDVLNHSMDTLKDALRDSGFNSTFLEVTVGGERGRDEQGRKEMVDNFGSLPKHAIGKIESIIPQVVDITGEDLVVDMVV